MQKTEASQLAVFKVAVLACAVAVCALGNPANAQQANVAPPVADNVVVLRGPAGEISLGDVRALASVVLPIEQRQEVLASASGVQQLALAAYTQKNLVAQARAAGYDQQADVKRVEQLAAQRALSDSWMIHQADIKAPALDKLEPYARTVFENETANHEAQPKVHVRHLLIRSGAEVGRTDEQALALASELLARAKAGEDFSSLAKQYSDDRKSAEQGGELAAFARGKMVPEFEQAAFALKKPGDLSAPVKTHFGYHLIELLERAIPGKPKFEDERDELIQKLLQERKEQIRRTIWQQAQEGIEFDVAAIESAAAKPFSEATKMELEAAQKMRQRK